MTTLSASAFAKARDRIENDIVLVHSLWHEYQYLFASGTERVEVLNFCAAWFFGLTQRVFIKEILLGIARLTDSASIGDHDNLTIGTLLDDPALEPASPAAARLKDLVTVARQLANPIRTHRNKYIAHLDQELAVAKATSSLPEVNHSTISNTLAALESAFNEHNRSVRNATMDFDVKSLKSADALFAILMASDRWQKWLASERENPSF